MTNVLILAIEQYVSAVSVGVLVLLLVILLFTLAAFIKYKD